MEILYADNHIIVVNKPSGLVTEAEEGESVELWVKGWLKEQYQKKGAVFVRAVHRLDKPVSGVLLLAKTSKALERLHASFRGKDVQKCYVAVVEGHFGQLEGFMEDYLVHEEFRASVSRADNPKAKLARLSYKVRKKLGANSIVDITLQTGRYHQIRVQFAHRGHSVLNDIKYGGLQVIGSRIIALHQERLTFSHPITNERLSFFVDAQPLIETFSA